MLLPLALVMTPWWQRSQRLTGHFVPTTLQVGASLYDGLNSQATGASNMKPVAEFERLYLERHTAEEDETAAQVEYRLDQRLQEEALGWLGTQPRAALRLAGIKFLRIWNIWPNEASFSAPGVRLAVAVTYIPLLILGLVGAVRTLGGGWPYWLCWFPAVYFTALHVVFVGSIRYRQPAMLALMVLAAGVATGWTYVIPAAQAHGLRPRDRRRKIVVCVNNQGGLSAIVARLVRWCWHALKWGLALIVIVSALAVPYFYRHLDERIHTQVLARLAKQYPGLTVTIRSAALVKGEGIEIRGLSILERNADGPRPELITYDECFLRCRTDLQDLLGGELEVTQVTIRHPTLYLTRRRNGSWSAAKLLPIPKMSKHPPQVTIENGVVEIFDPTKNPTSTLSLRDINLKLTPVNGGEKRKLQGTLSGDYFRHVTVEGVVAPHRPGFSLAGKIEGLDICPELRDAMPGELAAKLGLLETVRRPGAASFRVAYGAAAATPWQFSVAGQITHGRIDDSRLPHPLTDLRAAVRLSNDGFAIEDLTARSNQATLRLSAQGKSLLPGEPLSVQAEVRQLEIDRQLIETLPENLRQQWLKYRPDGQIDADAKLVYDGQHGARRRRSAA